MRKVKFVNACSGRVLFGKHKGEQLEQVPSGYLRWLYDSAWGKLDDLSKGLVMGVLEDRGHAPVRVRRLKTKSFQGGRWVEEITTYWRDEWGLCGTGEYDHANWSS